MKFPKATHGSFTTEKTYNAPPDAVFSAWSDIESRAKWFVGPGEWKSVRRELDFRVGGMEILHGRFGNGMEPLYESRFYSIAPDRRIVFVFDMHLNGKHHSVSLATVEIEGVETEKSRLTFTEQVTFLEGAYGQENTAQREEGTIKLLDQLTVFLETKG